MDVILFFAYIILLVINAIIANEKNRSVGWVIVASLFLSPIFSYLYLLAVPVKKIEENQKTKEK